MSNREARAGNRAAELREAFDRSFAQAPTTEAAIVENLLAIRIGSHPYALRLADVSGLFADKRVTSLPSPVSELLGIVGLRGTMLPVYDLGLLLGSPRAVSPRWLLVAAATPVGFAFDAFDGHLRVSPDVIGPAAWTADYHVPEVVQAVGIVRPLISVASILESIKRRVARHGLEKER